MLEIIILSFKMNIDGYIKLSLLEMGLSKHTTPILLCRHFKTVPNPFVLFWLLQRMPLKTVQIVRGVEIIV